MGSYVPGGENGSAREPLRSRDNLYNHAQPSGHVDKKDGVGLRRHFRTEETRCGGKSAQIVDTVG
jgi:hypothetical protein